MKKIRAYTRGERKRLIIHVFAANIQARGDGILTCANIAAAMDITPQTKLRHILDEMVRDGLLLVEIVPDTGIAGFRKLYSLNEKREGFAHPHHWTKKAVAQRTITLRSSRGIEALEIS